jgi:hypothetical protein
MANLLGQNIGANYRGILNLDATTINTPLNATLRAVTDGMGNTSQLFLSTTQVNIGGGSSLGRLVARGDGINVVARFESNSFANILSVRESDHTLLFGVGVGSLFPQIGLQTLNNPTSFATGNGQCFGYKSNFNMDWPTPMHSFYGENQIYNRVTLSNMPAGIAAFNGTFGISNVAASTFDYRMLNISYTINNTAASNRNATGIFLNATETGGGLNGMTHNLIDLQVGGVSRFRIQNNAASFVASANELSYGSTIRATDFQIGSGGSRIINFSDGVFRITNNAGNNFNRLQLGGITNDFPAIKRNGTGIDIRLADDSAWAKLQTGYLVAQSLLIGGNSGYDIRGTLSTISLNFNASTMVVAETFSLTNYGSAIFAIDSTTRGVLLPRMTTAQVNDIVSPADGLVVYNTTIGHLCVRVAGVWHKINHSTM